MNAPGPAGPPGTQNERTALAWQRTALSVAAGAAVLTRLTLGRLGIVAVIALVAVLALAGAVLLSGRGRYRHRVAGDVPAERAARTPWLGGIPPLALAVAVALLAAVELTALLIAP